MSSELQHRYICFCGVDVIGLPVCNSCARSMVAVLLGSATALLESGAPESTLPSTEDADEHLVAVRALAV